MTYKPQQLRAFADNPCKGSRMVPIHPDTLREIADRLDAAEALIRHCRFNREVTFGQVLEWQRDADAWLENRAAGSDAAQRFSTEGDER